MAGMTEFDDERSGCGSEFLAWEQPTVARSVAPSAVPRTAWIENRRNGIDSLPAERSRPLTIRHERRRRQRCHRRSRLPSWARGDRPAPGAGIPGVHPSPSRPSEGAARDLPTASATPFGDQVALESNAPWAKKTENKFRLRTQIWMCVFSRNPASRYNGRPSRKTARTDWNSSMPSESRVAEPLPS